MDLCSIGDVFGKLTGITSNEQCRSGCAQGVCPAGWMPTAADECSPECGRVFEPFCERPLPLSASLYLLLLRPRFCLVLLAPASPTPTRAGDQCGNMLVQAHMGGMEGMELFCKR